MYSTVLQETLRWKKSEYMDMHFFIREYISTPIALHLS